MSTPAGPVVAGTSTPQVTRYAVQSSDVIQDMRINVSGENSDKVIWYKERFLTDDEIVEHVVENYTSTICWTIHRPKRGWYIRIRSPTFPPGSFIQMLPVPKDSPHHADAVLSFKSRTNIPSLLSPKNSITLQDGPSSSTVHSYPPTPPPVPTLIIRPPSPTSIHTRLEEAASSGEPPRRAKPPGPFLTQITDFILAPYSVTVAQPKTTSFFARALSSLTSHRASYSNSFTLSRLSAVTPLSPPPPYTSNAPPEYLSSSSISTPLVTFHDHTHVLQVRSITGVLELDIAEERMLGVDTSFWIAVSLTYLEFLEERESYLAALND